MQKLLLAALLLLGVPACSVIAKHDITGKGIGAICASDSDCHASKCEATKRICVASCSNATDCPSPSSCFDGLCQLPMRVGVAHIGPTADEGGAGWSQTHFDGLQFAKKRLGYVTLDERPLVDPSTLPGIIDDMVAKGATVIVADSSSHRQPMIEGAQRHPDVDFLTCEGNVVSGNHGSYFGRMEQAWYIAGKAAAQVAMSQGKHRLGYVGSFVTPEVVRFINAFARGAVSADPSAVVEVEWMGFWFDTHFASDGSPQKTFACHNGPCFIDELLAQRLIDNGAVVVGHDADANDLVKFVDAYSKTLPAPVYSIGNNNPDACKNYENSCIGVSYWNWGPLYVSLFDEIHRHAWAPAVLDVNISTDSAVDSDTGSIASFVPTNGPAKGLLSLNGTVDALVMSSASGSSSLRGPYATNGQRDADGNSMADSVQMVAAAEIPTDAELARMCWFASNVIQKADPRDPMSADITPALVPTGQQPPDAIMPPGGTFDCNSPLNQ